MTTIKEATEKWVGQFAAIPQALVTRAYSGETGLDALALVAGGDRRTDCCDALRTDEGKCEQCEKECDEDDTHWSGAQYGWPAAWATMWIPPGMDQGWFRDHAEEVAACGVIVYESDECGVLIGVDGAGFDFYEAIWVPLYKMRGLQWHDEG